jgi:hypothetical protein
MSYNTLSTLISTCQLPALLFIQACLESVFLVSCLIMVSIQNYIQIPLPITINPDTKFRESTFPGMGLILIDLRILYYF